MSLTLPGWAIIIGIIYQIVLNILSAGVVGLLASKQDYTIKTASDSLGFFGDATETPDLTTFAEFSTPIQPGLVGFSNSYVKISTPLVLWLTILSISGVAGIVLFSLAWLLIASLVTIRYLRASCLQTENLLAQEYREGGCVIL